MKKAYILLKSLACMIAALLLVTSVSSCNSGCGAKNAPSHKHSYVAISDESYFVTLKTDGERVETIDFYNAYDYSKTFSVALKYNLKGNIKGATVYQYYDGGNENVKNDKCFVEYDKSGRLTELTVYDPDIDPNYVVFSVVSAENANGDEGYYLKYDGSASFFTLNEDGLAKTMLYEIGDEYLTLFATYTYDEKGRLSKIDAAAGESSVVATFSYEDGSCCFYEMKNEAEDGYSFTFDRDGDHNVIGCEFVSGVRSFSAKFKYDSNRQIIKSFTQEQAD